MAAFLAFLYSAGERSQLVLKKKKNNFFWVYSKRKWLKLIKPPLEWKCVPSCKREKDQALVSWEVVQAQYFGKKHCLNLSVGRFFELKFIEHVLNLLQSEKDKIFSKNFFLSVQTSGCLSETSLLLSLRCIYEHQRVCYIPSLPENESLWLNISLCTKVFYSWKLSGFVLFPLPFSLSLPFCKRRLLLTNQMGWFAQLWALFCL